MPVSFPLRVKQRSSVERNGGWPKSGRSRLHPPTLNGMGMACIEDLTETSLRALRVRAKKDLAL